MARQATANRSTGAQKWQVARPAENSQQADAPSEDEHGGSTRIPSSGGASPSASSTELGQQRGGPGGASNRLGAQDGFDETPSSKTQAQKDKDEKDDRARWADVESDGEEVIVFEGEHKNAGMNAGKVEDDGWATVPGKKPKNVKPKPRTGGKAGVSTAPTATAQRAAAQAEAASIAAVSRKAEEERKSTAYRPPRPDTRQSQAAHAKEDYDTNHGWDASSWGGGSSGRGGGSWASSKNSGWESGGWSQKHEASRSHGGGYGSAKGGGGGGGGFSKGRAETRGKEKSESFKRGPSVTTNMDASRLAW